MVILAVALALAIGCAAVIWATPVNRLRWESWLQLFALSGGAGVGITSVVYFLLLLAGAASPPMILTVEVILLLALAAPAIRLRGTAVLAPASPAPSPPASRGHWLLALALAGALLMVWPAVGERLQKQPYGGWDAWGIWNVRAKYLAGPGDSWRNAVSPLLAGKHSDYPLLLSGFIARTWKLSGSSGTGAPIAACVLFSLLTPALLVSALAALRGPAHAFLAALLLLGNRTFVADTTSQYADVPVSFYYLATLALVFLAQHRAALVAAGVFASLAAWTKDEGILFAAISILTCAWTDWRSRRWRWMTLGAAPVLLLVAFFKLAVAPSLLTPLGNQSLAQLAARAADPGRYAQIAKAVAAEIYGLGSGPVQPLLVAAILLVLFRLSISPAHSVSVRFAGWTFGLLIAGYLAVYLLTDVELGWLLSNSLSRAGTQLWPSCVFLLFVVLGNIDGLLHPRTESRRQARPLRRN